MAAAGSVTFSGLTIPSVGRTVSTDVHGMSVLLLTVSAALVRPSTAANISSINGATEQERIAVGDETTDGDNMLTRRTQDFECTERSVGRTSDVGRVGRGCDGDCGGGDGTVRRTTRTCTMTAVCYFVFL